MFKRVLVAMDLSPATEVLVAALPGLRDLGVEEIVLVHVAKPVDYPVSKAISNVEQVRKRLGKLRETLEQRGFSVEVDVPTGAPAAQIVRKAEEREAHAVVMGSRSQTRIQEAFVGSVTWDVVRRSRIPVLVQKIDAPHPDPEGVLEVRTSGAPQRVIYPTDFSSVAAGAFPLVEALAGTDGVQEIVLLHVHPVGDSDARQQARATLDSLAERLVRNEGVTVRVEVRGGSPAEEILALGGRDPRNLVVMGTHGRGFLPEIVLGSESRQVVRQASASVLLVPAAE
jgi:nucleotide-binding universal stress UspA family protein